MLLSEVREGRAINEQQAEGARQVLEAVAALPCVGFRQEDVAGQEDEDMASGTAHEEQHREERPAVLSGPEVEQHSTGIKQDHEGTEEVHHRIRERSGREQILQHRAGKQGAGEAVQQKMQ